MRFNFLKNRSVLYFPGCYSSAKLSEKVENYNKIFKKLKINPEFINDFFCCGGILIEAGYEKKVRVMAKENLEFLKQRGIKKIITNDSLCFKTLKTSYDKMLLDWNIDIEFALDSIYKKLKENEHLIKNKSSEKIFLHEPVYLLDYSELNENIKELLKLLGFEIINPQTFKEDILACGYEGGLKITNPELSNRIAKKYLESVTNEINQKVKIITPDPQAYIHLKENAEDNLEIIEFSDIICNSLNIKLK